MKKFKSKIILFSLPLFFVSSLSSRIFVNEYNIDENISIKSIRQVDNFYTSYHNAIIISDSNNDDHLYMWGLNTYGQLGIDSDSQNIYTPTEVPFLYPLKIKSSSFSTSSSSVVVNYDKKDHLYTWGNNQYGQLGFGDKVNRSVPEEVTSLPKGQIKEFDFGASHSSIVININGEDHLYTWGSNQYGQLGIGSTADKMEPTEVTLLPPGEIKEVSNGYDFSSVVLRQSDGLDHLYTWGNNEVGQLGLNDKINRTTPTEVTELPQGEIKKIDSSINGAFPTEIYSSCSAVININGKDQLFLWGSSLDDTNHDKPQKFNLPIEGEIKDFDFDYYNGSIIIKGFNDGLDHLYTWGDNGSSQLGLGDDFNDIDFLDKPAEVKYLPQGEIKSVRLGIFHTSIILNFDNRDHLFVWGDNYYGQLGLGKDVESVNAPRLLFSSDEIVPIDNNIKNDGWLIALIVILSILVFGMIVFFGIFIYRKYNY